MARSAWEEAYHSKQRVFFEPATDTVRTCPENYCLAFRRDGKTWEPFVDAAMGPLRAPIAALVTRHHGVSPDRMVTLLTNKIKGRRGRR